jgi:CRISPR-associated endonuclease Cas1
MADTKTVPQHHQYCNSSQITPRNGVVTLFGYGSSIRVKRGHLILEDGIGGERRQARFARVGHDLKRLVVIGSDGIVSFAALRWLADQDSAFVMLERDGCVLATTGPVRPSDARLRRAQALSNESGAATLITKELISRKLAGQAQVATERLDNLEVTGKIAQLRTCVESANSIDKIRSLESQAAKTYWRAWKEFPVNFPKFDMQRVPDHWRRFGTRESPLTNSPRLAANPPNAILNYLYAILESEARLAAAALGLDPGLGVLHVDSRTRDSLACDLMEPVRPMVDAYLLDWLRRGLLRREWFFEQRDGNCRLMGEFAQQLSETAKTWSDAVAPHAERCARILWSTVPKATDYRFNATPLTQTRRRAAKGVVTVSVSKSVPSPPTICQQCGKSIRRGTESCSICSKVNSREALLKAAQKGRIAAQQPQVLARLGEKQRSHRLAELAWKPEDKPAWLDETVYAAQVHPKLANYSISRIAMTLGVSLPYASDIRAGRRRPHPRHWLALAGLVGESLNR